MEEDKKHNDVFISHEHIKKVFSEQALKNLEELLPHFNLELDLNKQMHFTKYNEKYKSIDLLKTHCKEGLKYRLTKYQYPNYPLSYINQLKHELEVIEQMNFADYFLVVQDYVNFAKQNGILVGPGRGSAAGSLISYLLGITAIDPIQYELIFERFLNSSRKSMPDIDVDFLDERRQEVINYMFERYGYEKTAHIITFQTIKVKSAIKDAGRVLGYNFKTLNQITAHFPFMIEEINGEQLKQMIEGNKALSLIAKQYKELFAVVFKIIGIPRQIGVHAAGIVIGDQPL
jgi:DNA polymerase-3 subunit alpha